MLFHSPQNIKTVNTGIMIWTHALATILSLQIAPRMIGCRSACATKPLVKLASAKSFFWAPAVYHGWPVKKNIYIYNIYSSTLVTWTLADYTSQPWMMSVLQASHKCAVKIFTVHSPKGGKTNPSAVKSHEDKHWDQGPVSWKSQKLYGPNIKSKSN